MNDKAWQKPELVVLVRSHPEEAVLLVCKVEITPAGQEINASHSTFKGCWDPLGNNDCGPSCQGRGGGGS